MRRVTGNGGPRLPASAAGTGFWAGFAGRYFRREAAEFGDGPAALQLSPEEMFRLLLRACADRGSGPARPQVRFHVGAGQVLADVADYLPAAADESLDGYFARLETQLYGAPYLLAVQRAHAASRPVWKRAAEFLAGLHDATGLPPGNADIELFAGRYPATAPGIHRERSGVFVSAATGSKDILVWPPERDDLPLGTLRYAESAASARRLRCEPGRLVYWPALHWHVGECPEVPTAALHLTVVEEPLRLPDMIARTIADVGDLADDLAGAAELQAGPADDQGGGPDHQAGPAGDPASGELGLPDRYEAAVAILTGQLGDPGRVRDQLTADWLRRRTGLGFGVPPPRHRDFAVTEDDLVLRDSVRPVVLVRRDAATSWCAADGRVADVRSAAALTELINWLNTGQPLQVRAGLRLAGNDADRALLRRVLSLLAAWRSVKVTGS